MNNTINIFSIWGSEAEEHGRGSNPTLGALSPSGFG